MLTRVGPTEQDRAIRTEHGVAWFPVIISALHIIELEGRLLEGAYIAYCGNEPFNQGITAVQVFMPHSAHLSKMILRSSFQEYHVGPGPGLMVPGTSRATLTV